MQSLKISITVLSATVKHAPLLFMPVEHQHTHKPISMFLCRLCVASFFYNLTCQNPLSQSKFRNGLAIYIARCAPSLSTCSILLYMYVWKTKNLLCEQHISTLTM